MLAEKEQRPTHPPQNELFTADMDNFDGVKVEKSNLLQHACADDRVRSRNPVDLSLHVKIGPSTISPTERFECAN
jgi:hypothetical protein